MATGSFWNVDDPLKPWALFDPNAIIDIPIEIGDWLTSLGSTYASHTIIASDPLEAVSSSHSAGTIVVRMQVASGAEYTSGMKYPFTVRLVCADGQQDDRTLRLKVTSR